MIGVIDMRSTLSNTIMLVSALALSACSTNNDEKVEFVFSGTISVDGSVAKRYKNIVSTEQFLNVEFGSGIRIEYVTPVEDGDNALTFIRVLRRNGDDYQTLKQIRTFAPSNHVRSFSYAICDDQVYSTSPESLVVSCQS